MIELAREGGEPHKARMESARVEKTGRAFWFRLVAAGLPFAALLCAEGVMRLRGHGGYPAFLREAGRLPGGEMLCLVEPAASKPYFFNNPNRPGYADQTTFAMPKPAGTFRIFLVGESAAKGYPQPRNLCIAAFLEAILGERMPGRKIEAINLGTTAVASFPLVYQVRDALKYDPDLMVFYVGNNEFYGAYGVASLNAAGAWPGWALRAMRAGRGLAIVQALSEWRAGKRSEDRTLMEEMVGHAAIPADSRLRRAAARNLEANLGRMLAEAKAAGVPAIACTTASNESGMAPLGEDGAGDGDGTASGKFRRGKKLAGEGDLAGARAAFVAARDLDPMPWRPTTAIEGAIRAAAAKQGATLCDVAEILRGEGSEGATGWETMDDHVHLSLRGQERVARAIADAMAGVPGLPRWGAEASGGEGGDWRALAAKLGANAYDEYAVHHVLRVLFGIGFMRRSNPEALERNERACREAEARMAPEALEAARSWQSSRPHAGGMRPLTGMMARVLLRGGKVAEALELYEIARRQVPEYTSWHIEYEYFALACREKLAGGLDEGERERAGRAIAEGAFLLAHGEAGTGLTERYMGRLRQLRGEWAEAIPLLEAARPSMRDEDLVACEHALVASLVRTGRLAEAAAVAEGGLRGDRRFAAAYRQMRAEVEAARAGQGEKERKGAGND